MDGCIVQSLLLCISLVFATLNMAMGIIYAFSRLHLLVGDLFYVGLALKQIALQAKNLYVL